MIRYYHARLLGGIVRDELASRRESRNVGKEPHPNYCMAFHGRTCPKHTGNLPSLHVWSGDISGLTSYQRALHIARFKKNSVNAKIIVDSILPLATNSWLLLVTTYFLSLLQRECCGGRVFYTCILSPTTICTENCTTQIILLLFLSLYQLVPPDNYQREQIMSPSLSICNFLWLII